MESLFDLNQQVVVITGGYGYLGAAMVQGLLQHNANVCVFGRDEEKFYKRFETHSNLSFLKCDISDSSSIKAAFEEVRERYESIDVLINNAFYVKGQNPLAISDEDWQYSIDGSMNSVYRCIREVVPIFKQSGIGNIINIASMYGIVSPDFSVYENNPQFLNPPHYGAAKAGVIQLTKYYARYLGSENIRVNCISPGPFPNEAVQENAQFIDDLSRKTALQRIGNPCELQGAIVFLASQSSSYITGHNLVVDGGWTLT